MLQVKLRNFGTLQEATFNLSTLTVLCGENNTGKTYAVYAFYGFLDFWNHSFILPDAMQWAQLLQAESAITLDIKQYRTDYATILKEACEQYSRSFVLGTVFGTSPTLFRKAEFELLLTELIPVSECASDVRVSEEGVHFELSGDSLKLSIDRQEAPQMLLPKLRNCISDIIKASVFGASLPRIRIVCAERTGTVIFQPELDFTRSRVLDIIRNMDDASAVPLSFLQRFLARYPLPVARNVDTVRAIPSKSVSFLADSDDTACKEVLRLFSEIAGGSYEARETGMCFVPEHQKRVSLDMLASSSSIRALFHLGVYLLFEAKRGDLLIIDEPEQNLHPKNQRKMARLLARLLNLGVSLLITTHSDYFIREFNALIMLNQDTKYVRQIRQEKGYVQEELLAAEKVGVYCTQRAVKSSKSSGFCVLTPVEINADTGIAAKTFDDTLAEMNEIQELLYFPEDSVDD